MCAIKHSAHKPYAKNAQTMRGIEDGYVFLMCAVAQNDSVHREMMALGVSPPPDEHLEYCGAATATPFRALF